MSRLKFAELAGQDLQEIHDYIAKDNIEAASAFIERLYNCCHLLAATPNIGRKRNDIAPGLRGITEGNYLILYHHIVGGIVIVRVFHTARDIKKILRISRS